MSYKPKAQNVVRLQQYLEKNKIKVKKVNTNKKCR
tara:strand:+ start:30315 stop:30419 length:105 start_codon:yes stop_codon:yes gene_type:complete